MEKHPSEEADSSSASGNYPHLMEAEWRERLEVTTAVLLV